MSYELDDKLAKRVIHFKEVKGLVISPGDIYWRQKAGGDVLVSKKTDFLNLELIEKLAKSNQMLVIENQTDLELQNNLAEKFRLYELEPQVRDKQKVRNDILNMFANYFIDSTRTQFDLNQLGWMVFSDMKSTDAKKYLDLDIEMFNRSLNISTSYTLCAFVIGYTSMTFLRKLFVSTFVSLMTIEKPSSMTDTKTKLDSMRERESLSDEDRDFLKNLYLDKEALFIEKYDGSGLLNINRSEMSDLEVLLIALCQHYSFHTSTRQPSIFYEIKNHTFNCDKNILNLMDKTLSGSLGQSILSA